MAQKKIDIKVNTKGTEKAQGKFKKLGQSISGVSNLLKGAFAAAVIAGAFQMAKLAAEAEGVEIAFKRLNRSDLLDRLRAATKNTVSDLDLMKRAVQAQNFKISLEALPKLLEFAAQRARETGESVDYLVESLVLGIGRKSVMILDNLGLSAIEVREEFQKTGDMAVAVGNIINREQAANGVMLETTADKLAQVTTRWENMSAAIGGVIVELGYFSLVDIPDLFSYGMSNFTRDTIKAQEAVEDLVEEVGEMGPQMDVLDRMMRKDLGGAAGENFKAISFEGKKATNVMEAVIGSYAHYRKELIATAAEEEKLREFGLIWLVEQAQRHELQKAINIDNNEFVDILGQQLYGIQEITVAESKWEQSILDTASAIEYRNDKILGFADQFAGAMSFMLLSGELTFGRLADLFITMLARMATEMAAKAAIFSIFDIGGHLSLGGAGTSLLDFLGFAKGGDFVTSGPQLIMVGDNPGGRERVQVTPESSPNISGPSEGMTVNFYGNITDKRYVQEFIVPELQKAVRIGRA